MFRKTIPALLLTIIGIVNNLPAQDYYPFSASNYSGVTGVSLQPASIADSRYKMDFQFMGTSFNFKNTFAEIDPYAVWHPKALNSREAYDTYILPNWDGKDKSLFTSLRIDFFSLMFNLSDKDAIAFSPSFRSILNLDNFTENLVKLADSGLNYPDLWYMKLTNANFNAQVNNWADFGITYARVLIPEGKHFLKAGVTLKISQGIGSAYIFGKDIQYRFDGTDTLSLFQSDIKYGVSSNFDIDFNNVKFRPETNPSLNFDFGIVYEYRPDWLSYKYDMDGKSDLWRRDRDKYLFRLGLSVTDLGRLRYQRSKMSGDFTANIKDWYIGDYTFGPDGTFSTIEAFNDTLNNRFIINNPESKYNMNLPLVASLQADVRISRTVYFNVTPYVAMLQGAKDENKVHYITTVNFAPSFDTKWFGLSLPFQYTSYDQFRTGFAIRLGPVWLGSRTLISNLASAKNIRSTDFSMAMKFPVFYKNPKDRDNDKVSNRKDQCPDSPGPWELRGCPDTDGDGITDAEDKCPNHAGPKESMGCPDTDGDGIFDMNDDCPDVKGLPQFKGCPDSDGDGIIDKLDDCPFNAGPAETNGCPDQDGDLIPDKDDNCPTLAGTRQYKGCPFVDTDGDGVKDDEDRCPGIPGPPENQGCPYSDTDNDGIPDKDDDCPTIAGTAAFKGCPDTDGDGISDKYDLCPTIAGVAANNGCPEIKKEEQEIIRKAFDNLEFETGKAVIKSSSTGSLNELAGLMKQHPEWKLRLAGHTDNVGKPETNLALSKNRTLAVMQYLVSKGADKGKIITEWYGQTNPVADNGTPEGRQRNRRVEMMIVFE